MTAENFPVEPSYAVRGRFNEAAADDRGKHASLDVIGDWRNSGFNEAAADDRGKLPRPEQEQPGMAASMRPRPMTAENWRTSLRASATCGCFNEAAADDRGKPMQIFWIFPAATFWASMRPRPMTAENPSPPLNTRSVFNELQ